MKKVTIAALVFAAAFTSAPLLAQEVSPVKTAVAQYTTLFATYQAEKMSAEAAKAAALAEVTSDVTELLNNAPNVNKRAVLLTALEAATEFPQDVQVDIVNAIVAAALAANMEDTEILAVAVEVPGLDQDLIDQELLDTLTAAGPGNNQANPTPGTPRRGGVSGVTPPVGNGGAASRNQ